MTFYPVIMCGGSGARLWPLSRPTRPKQFIPLIGHTSPFRETLSRVAGLGSSVVPIVVAGQAHADWLAQEAAEAGIEIEVLLEPTARESGPAVAAAAARIAERDPAGVAVIVASDHHIPDADAFCESVRLAGRAAADGWVVTMGIGPTSPATAYGYIRPGDGLAGLEPVRQNLAFVEKPDAETAAAYVEAGYLWNSGNFIARADVLLAELDRYEPKMAEAARAAVAGAEASSQGWRLGAAFLDAPKKSFDYAVMERTDRAAVLPAAFAWSDLGAWDAVWAASAKDEGGNAAEGDVVLQGATDCLVRVSGDLEVAIVGAERLAVVGDGRSLLICGLEASQGVKAVAERLQKPQRNEVGAQSLKAWSDRFDLWFRGSALPAWWALGGDRQNGGFHEQLGFDGLPVPAPRRARVQARLAFVFARAAKLGHPGPWAEAAEHGWRFFDQRYKRSDGLYRTLVAPDGGALDDTATLYDQAFALLALAALHEIAPEDGRRRATARTLLDAVGSAFRHGQGGYREIGAQAFQANPQMHLLEAALAWFEADGDEAWLKLARELADLALTQLFDQKRGLLREYFAGDWSPAEGDAGRIVDPGHQFEWAWLLDRFGRLSGSQAATETAFALYRAGSAGWDPVRRVAVDEIGDDLGWRRATARLWPQTELLKASVLLSHSRNGEAADLDGRAQAAAATIWRYLEAPIPGLWCDRMAPDGRFESGPAPASSFYHLFGAIQALAQAGRD